MDHLGRKLRLAYYDASDGPRVVFFGPLDADFESLEREFEKLSRGLGSVEISALPFVQAFGVSLQASSCGSILLDPKGKPQGLRRVPGNAGVAFQWSRTSEGWDYLASLVGSLARNPASAHQYLTAYPAEDAIVVVSKGEYGDEVLGIKYKPG